MKSMCKQNILINSWMELTLTTLIKAIVLHTGEGGRGGGGEGGGGEGERGGEVAVLVINN